MPETFGVRDEDLTYQQNFAAIASIGARVRTAGIPPSVDVQDGYGDRIVECIQTTISLGAGGANIEDSIPGKGDGQDVQGSLRDLNTQKYPCN